MVNGHAIIKDYILKCITSTSSFYFLILVWGVALMVIDLCIRPYTLRQDCSKDKVVSSTTY